MGRNPGTSVRSPTGTVRREPRLPVVDAPQPALVSETPAVVQLGPHTCLTLAGRGAPRGPLFDARIAALYGVTYALKMVLGRGGRHVVVGRLEAFRWGENQQADYLSEAPATWRWKLALRVPRTVREEQVNRAITLLAAKGRDPLVKDVRLETVDERVCVAALHVGRCDQKHVTLQGMKRLATERGLPFHAFHHEIYLSDLRHAGPEPLRTILRLPVTPPDEASGSVD